MPAADSDSPSTDPKAIEAYPEAQARIADAARNGSKSLGLSGLGLTSVPLEIRRLANLTTLNLGGNQLTSVPPEIGKLANLTRLDLDVNQLESLQESLGRCTQLRALFLHDNPKLDIPASVLGVSWNEWDTSLNTAPKPSSGKPVHDWKPTDKGWSNIAEGIERVIEARNKRTQPKQ